MEWQIVEKNILNPHPPRKGVSKQLIGGYFTEIYYNNAGTDRVQTTKIYLSLTVSFIESDWDYTGYRLKIL